jgi:peptidoglycan hydrolase-like protein with peptidoglycan-binding domain
MNNLPSIRVINPFFGHSFWMRRSILFIAVLVASFHLLYAEDGSVAGIQEALKKKSFYFGEVTGNLDEPTRAGLRRFQIRNGLPATGEMDRSTVQALNRDSAPSPKPDVLEQIPNAAGHSSEQSDKAFLNDLEKGENRASQNPTINNGAHSEAPTAGSVDEHSHAPAPENMTQGGKTLAPKMASEPLSRDQETQKSTPGRAPEATRAKVIADRRNEARGKTEEPEPVEDGLLDSHGVRIQPLSNIQRERAAQKAVAESAGSVAPTPLPRASSITTVTTRFMGADGRIYTTTKTTTIIPRAYKSELPSNQPQTFRPRRFLFWERNERGEWGKIGGHDRQENE